MKTMIEDKLNTIEIPGNLHERCTAGVKRAKMEERKMKKTQGIKKLAAAAAVLTICVLAAGNTAIAGTVKGFFKDLTRFDGAITGQEYLQATDEVKIDVQKVSTENDKIYLSVEMVFLEKEKPPFREIEWVTIYDFSVVDESGELAVSAKEANITGIVNNGMVKLEFEVEKAGIEEGKEYTLVIDEFESSKKADAPTMIKGEWKCKWSIAD